MTWGLELRGALFALELLHLGEDAIESLFTSLITECLVQVSPRLHEIEYALLRVPGAYCLVNHERGGAHGHKS
jgi:hypothetical protein